MPTTIGKTATRALLAAGITSLARVAEHSEASPTPGWRARAADGIGRNPGNEIELLSQDHRRGTAELALQAVIGW